jgi:hypothetical protein
MNVEWQIVTAVAFSLAVGGVVGWYVAKKRRAKDDANHTPTDSRNLFTRAVSALLVLLAIGSTFQIMYFQHQQERQAAQLAKVTDCQYRVNKALIEVLSNRQNPTQEKDKRLVDMVQAILTAKSREESRKVLTDFIDAMNALDATRTSNPYPTIPADCRPDS